MANIPENTDNPILRPVTRLETTTKVFGGEYIPDDAQQSGVSNLQAIELAERDQYILSRVGQPYVPASGDIPGQVGIAPLDTSGKVPKAQLPTDAVYTEETQTLKNKTITAGNNTITKTSVQIPASTTLNPTKWCNYHILKNSGTDPTIVITVGTIPYVGYELNIECFVDNSYVIFKNNANVMVCLGLLAGDRITLVGQSMSAQTWFLKGTNTFYTAQSTIDNAPTGYLPNDWKAYYGRGTNTFVYNSANTVSLYGTPTAYCSVTTTHQNDQSGNAICYYNSSGTEMPTRINKQFGGTWTGWIDILTHNGTQTMTNKTIDSNSNTLVNVVTSKNITNCITAIPQDINLTLSSGVLTLKSGSKVYVPNGFETDGTTPKFTTYTTNKDWTLTTTTNGKHLVCAGNNGGISSRQVANCVSGAGVTTTNGFTYNTTTNVIHNWTSVELTGEYSFPICIVTVSGGAISSIDQVFNGMGYIGKTVFVLPGVKGLIPGGRNADGTLKNTDITASKVLTVTSASTRNNDLYLSANAIFEGAVGTNYYDETTNYIKRISDDAVVATLPICSYTTTSGVISNFKPKTAFHAVDYNDWQRQVGSGKVHETTTFSDSATSGSLKWCVLNRICYVTAVITRTAAGNNIVIFQSLPKPKMACYGQGFSGRGMIFVEVGYAYLYLNCVTANSNIFASLSYPVADDWVES